MSTRRFVSGSSVILAGWLGATFLNDVPETKYPKLDKKPGLSATLLPSEKAIASHVSEVELAGPQWR